MIAYVDPKIFHQKRNSHHQMKPYSLNKKSDIYSIGILLWELSSGRPPFCNELSNTSDIGLTLEILQGLREIPVPNTPENYIKIYTGKYNLILLSYTNYLFFLIKRCI
jgi:serine/threonine protein kinase